MDAGIGVDGGQSMWFWKKQKSAIEYSFSILRVSDLFFYCLMYKLFGNFVRVFLILNGVNFGKRMSYLLPIKILDKFQKEAIVRQVSKVKCTMRIKNS